MIEKEFVSTSGFCTKVITRTRKDMQRVVDNNPFADRDTGKLHVTFLSELPLRFPEDEMDAAVGGDEAYSNAGMEIYIHCPHGYGHSRLTNSLFEKKLGVSATTRNWRTVNVLLSMMTP